MSGKYRFSPPDAQVPTPLFGRDKDLDLIGGYIEEGRQVVLVGPPGIGKTSLAVELLRRFADANWLAASLPAAQAANIQDLAQLIMVQMAMAIDVPSDSMMGATETLFTSVADPDQQLSVSFELLAQAASERGKALLVIDDVDALFASSRSAELGQTFMRKLRSTAQRTKCLSTVFLARSDAVVRDTFEDHDAPMFGSAMTHRLEPLANAVGSSFIRERIESRDIRVTEEAIARMQVACEGVPLLLRMSSDAVVSAAKGLNASVVDLPVTEQALAQLQDSNGPVIAERLDAIRRSHRLGLDIARRLAKGESPYSNEQLPNNVTRVLKNLERLGLARRPEPREWLLTDPLVAETLRRFDPQALAASSMTTIHAGATSPPSPDRCVRHLRENSIWGLDAQWFEPRAVLRDAVHGDISVTRLELTIMESPEFQRLRRLRQLGSVHLVYPSANHTKFEHSVGALASSSSLVETLLPDPQSGFSSQRVTDSLSVDSRERLEIIALTRVAALIHDLATVPCANALETGADLPLEVYGDRLARLWDSVVDGIEAEGLSRDETISLKEGRFFNSLLYACRRDQVEENVDYAFVRDLVRGLISADSFDFMARDQHSIGLPPVYALPIASGMRLVDVVDESSGGQRIAIDLKSGKGGDFRSQFLQHCYLLSQHRERIFNHPKTQAANAMLAGAVYRWLLLFNEREDETGNGVEDHLLRQGDDGLLEYLRNFAMAEESKSRNPESSQEIQAVGHLINGVMNRRLYERVACVRSQAHVATQLSSELGDAQTRYHLERDAARAAGIQDLGRILLVIPPPPSSEFDELLVRGESGVGKVRNVDDPTCSVIRELSERLRSQWEISVFADPAIEPEKVASAIDWLALRLQLRWEFSASQS